MKGELVKWNERGVYLLTKTKADQPKVCVDLICTVHKIIVATKEEILIEIPFQMIEQFSTTSENDNIICIELKDIRFLYLMFNNTEQRTSLLQTLKKIKQQEMASILIAFKRNEAGLKVDEGWNVYKAHLEYARLGLPNGFWVTSDVNEEYSLCDTYPNVLAVPKILDDAQLMAATKERSRGRIPVLVWLSLYGSASLCRCSQPLVGLSNRSLQGDAILLNAIHSTNKSHKLIIVDARPKANAIANSALGGGYESYSFSKTIFMNIANIHVIRESFIKLKEEIEQSSASKKVSIEFSSEAVDNWLEHVKTILTGAVKMAHIIAVKDQSVLVHCSDGWDRTPQLTSTTCLLLDPAYRTLKGFEILIEKEWCSFGHKFSERNGYFLSLGCDSKTEASERCPVFLQWLDTVYQIMYQFPTQFEFNEKFLIFIIDQLYACNYGTFLFDCEKTRTEIKVKETSTSLWTVANDDNNISQFLNPFFDKAASLEAPVLFPSVERSSLKFWKSYYLRWFPPPTIIGEFRSQSAGINDELLEKGQELQQQNTLLTKELISLQQRLGMPVTELKDVTEEIYTNEYSKKSFPSVPVPTVSNTSSNIIRSVFKKMSTPNPLSTFGDFQLSDFAEKHLKSDSDSGKKSKLTRLVKKT
uniref:Myotubularin phosphatase domain-containing protein n=1 Tax=Arcella intermedia TaxID=1963864 RepID=A0A6B2KZQ4_9EUKA